MLKRYSLLILLLTINIVLPGVLASSIGISIVSSQDEVDAGSSAVYSLKITNNGIDRDVFTIDSDEFSVYPFSEFAQKIEATPYQVKLDPEESALVKVTIKTLETAPVNKYYDATMVIASVIHQENKESLDLKTYIASPKNLIEITPQIPEKLVPGKEVKIPITLKNRSGLTKTLEIITATDIPKIAEPLEITLKPQEEIQEEITLTLDPSILPGKKRITISAYEQDQMRGSFVAEVEILPKDRIEEDKEVKKGFLSAATTITRENKGNTVAEQRIEASYNLVQRIFSSMTPKPETEKGKVVWKFTLSPGDKKSIEIDTNYRPLLYGIIIIAIFTLIIIFSIERSVVVKKRIFHGKDIGEGVKEYKLFLLLRNGKKFPLNDVKVMDLVPNTVDLSSDFGSLQPDRVQHGDRATRLLWNVIKLEPGEERVFSYKVKKKSNILGELVLPAAIIQYVDNKDKFEQVQSMRIILE